MIPAQWVSAYSKATRNIYILALVGWVVLGFFFARHIQWISEPHHALLLHQICNSAGSGLAQLRRGCAQPSSARLPELKVRGRFTVPVPGCVHAIASTRGRTTNIC